LLIYQLQISYPRILYLPFLLPKLHAFFFPSLIDPNCQPHQGWFSFEGVPLKWHYPVGLLYDLYSGAEPISRSSGGVAEGNPTHHSISITRRDGDGASGESQIVAEEKVNFPLPWRLTVHFQNWPDQDLVRLDPDGMVMHDAFINSVKEADFLRNGNAKGIMTLSKEDSSGLWKAVQDRKQTFPLFNSLLLTSTSGLPEATDMAKEIL
jgi:autophagy-related protein 5